MKPLISLTAIGALCAVLLAGTYAVTGDAIRINREAHGWRIVFNLIGSVFPTTGLDWNGDRLELPNGYQLRRTSVNGYAGAIELLAAFDCRNGAGALAGARVTKHQETPGLGDFIDTTRSPWILQFSNRPPEQVDGVTGATITSESVRRGVLALMQYPPQQEPKTAAPLSPHESSSSTEQSETPVALHTSPGCPPAGVEP